MLHKINFTLVCFLCLSTTVSSKENRGFVRVDKVCVTVDNERPILLSEVKRKAETMESDYKAAQQELMEERAMRVAAGKMLKINLADIKETRNKHIRKIIESNKLTLEEFESRLKGPPLFMTLRQYEDDIDNQIIKGQFDASVASKVQISPREIEAEIAKRAASPAKFVVIFISIAPKKGLKKADALRLQFIRAKNIRQEILGLKDLNALQKNYSGQSDVSIVGPLDYEEDSLMDRYDLQLKKNPTSRVTEPFEDGGVVTMIVKEKVLQLDNQKTALEKVGNDLYNRAVQQGRNAVTKRTLANSSVEINCEW